MRRLESSPKSPRSFTTDRESGGFEKRGLNGLRTREGPARTTAREFPSWCEIISSLRGRSAITIERLVPDRQISQSLPPLAASDSSALKTSGNLVQSMSEKNSTNPYSGS